MAAAELRAGGVPEQLHDLDALYVAHIVGAAHILRQVAVDVGIAEILSGGGQVDQAGGDNLAHRLDDAWIASDMKVRYASAPSMFGSTAPPAHGIGL